MAFDPLDQLTSIIAGIAATTHQCTLYGLGIDDGSTGLRLSVALLPHASNQLDSDLFNDSIDCPLFKVVVHTLPFRKVVRQHAPLTTCFQQVEDGIEHAAQAVFTFPFDVQEVFDNFPLAVGNSGGISFHSYCVCRNSQ